MVRGQIEVAAFGRHPERGAAARAFLLLYLSQNHFSTIFFCIFALRDSATPLLLLPLLLLLLLELLLLLLLLLLSVAALLTPPLPLRRRRRDVGSARPMLLWSFSLWRTRGTARVVGVAVTVTGTEIAAAEAWTEVGGGALLCSLVLLLAMVVLFVSPLP